MALANNTADRFRVHCSIGTRMNAMDSRTLSQPCKNFQIRLVISVIDIATPIFDFSFLVLVIDGGWLAY